MEDPLSFDALSSMSNEERQKVSEDLTARLTELAALPTATTDEKEQAWSKVLSIWCATLRYPASMIPSNYKACASLLPVLLRSTGFFDLTRNPSIARENCFTCITQLNRRHIKDYLAAKTHLNDHRITDPLYRDHAFYLLLVVAQTISSLPFATNEDLQFIDDHTELLTVFIERVDRAIPGHSRTEENTAHSMDAVDERALGFLWNMADRTVLVSTLLRVGLVERVVRWLGKATMLTEKGSRPLISIIHNIARHDHGADELNKHDALDAIKQYRQM